MTEALNLQFKTKYTVHGDEGNREIRQTRAKTLSVHPNAYCLLVITNVYLTNYTHASGLRPADYPVLKCLGQTCTGIVYIQEVLYILHLSSVVLDYTPVI